MFALKASDTQIKAKTGSTNNRAPKRSTFAKPRFGDTSLDQAILLQRTIGNQATLRLLSQPARHLTEKESHGHDEQEADQANLSARGAMPGVSWDFSKIP